MCTEPPVRTKCCSLEELIGTYDGDDHEAFASRNDLDVCGGTACQSNAMEHSFERALLCGIGCAKAAPAAVRFVVVRGLSSEDDASESLAC